MKLDDFDVTPDGAALLDEVHAELTAYVAFPSPESAVAVTLFIGATHAQTAAEHATRLVVKSPLRRCGKTRLLEVCRETVHNALPTANISAAALARSISEDDPPTLLLDEADTVFGKRKGELREGAEDVRGILNAGHSRGWPYRRWNANRNTAESCPTFAMAVIAGIGDMPDTIEDRAVVISMRRRAAVEQVRSWRSRRAVPALRELRGRLHDWSSRSWENWRTRSRRCRQRTGPQTCGSRSWWSPTRPAVTGRSVPGVRARRSPGVEAIRETPLPKSGSSST
jgi:hypothetical protein